MPSRKIEAQLELLASVRRSGTGSEDTALLQKLLADPVGLVVAKAADVTAELQLRNLIPDLLRAYARLFELGPKRDAQCWGKIAIAKALKELDHAEAEPFVRALSYQQWEPVWGTEVDTAGPLRAIAIMALLQCNDLLREDKLWHVMRGLTDAETTVRLDAARTLEQMEGREAVLLLRLKARMGDKDAGVTGQVLQSVLHAEGATAVPFVGEFLFQRGWNGKDDELAEHAALALGASRLPSALELLIDCWRDRMDIALKQEVVLRALSSSRDEHALEFLLSIVREGRYQEATTALEALGLHQDSESIRKRTQSAVTERGNPDLDVAFKRAFQ